MQTVQATRKQRRWLLLALGAALALRLILAAVTEGYPYDMGCFTAWGDKLAAQGPADFYSEGYFADYPPGYLWVLGAVALLRRLLHSGTVLDRVLLALVPALCDCGCTALIWEVGRRHIREEKAVRRLALFAAFCPVMLFDTGVWKQIDGVFALPLLLCFALLERRRWLPAALCYGIALAVKPQALLAGPVLAVCFLAGVPGAKPGRRLQAVLRIPAGAAIALLPPLLAGLPFFGMRGLVSGLLEKYFGTATSYPYATINAFNWFMALGGNWVDQNAALFGPITWQMLGTAHILLLTAALAVLAVRGWRAKRFSPVLLAAFYVVGVFVLGHRMHERYLILGVLLVLLAAARCNDARLLGIGAGLSLTAFLNLAAVYTTVDTDDMWLSSAASSLFGKLVGFAATLLFVLLAYTVWQLCGGEAPDPVGHRSVPPEESALPDPMLAPPDDQPRWTRQEKIRLLALTAATAAVSFVYLGDLTAPQNPLDAEGRTVTTEFMLAGDTVPALLWVYPGIGRGGTLTVSDADTGEVLHTQTLEYTDTFCWSEWDFSAGSGTQRFSVTVENGTVFELALRDASGELVAVSGGGALFDEQGAVPNAISQLNSMYFDEIYHGRTAYEMLHALPIYETTHPPLGKEFIMLGVAIFGMTGFGWRFSGTLFGVLLVPLAYGFARRLTRKPWVAGVTAVLLALDQMRFVQSRIATIDIYGTFFILLGGYFMLWYCQSVLNKGVENSLLPMALGGAAFGLGCASKWTGIYAGAGLAVLYLGVLYLRWRQKPPHFRDELITAGIGGVVFYVILPLLIYIASYFPYLWRDPGFGLQDWWNCQIYMFRYHSTLEATHPFESRWYTWPLILRPIWYYMNRGLPGGMAGSIAGIGGPVVWLGGAAAMLALGWKLLKGWYGPGKRRAVAVLVLYLTQLIPWMLVTRCTFIYHYFPSSMFGLMALALLLGLAGDQRRAGKWGAALCGVSLAVFVCFYPAVSGLPVPDLWAKSLQLVSSWAFYSV